MRQWMGLECRPQTPGQGSSPRTAPTGLAPGPSLEASGLWTALGLGFSHPWPAQHPAIEPRLTTMIQFFSGQADRDPPRASTALSPGPRSTGQETRMQADAPQEDEVTNIFTLFSTWKCLGSMDFVSNVFDRTEYSKS